MTVHVSAALLVVRALGGRLSRHIYGQIPRFKRGMGILIRGQDRRISRTELGG